MWLYEGSKNIWSHTTWVSQARIFGPTWVYHHRGQRLADMQKPVWCGGFPPHLNIHRHSHHFHYHHQHQHMFNFIIIIITQHLGRSMQEDVWRVRLIQGLCHPGFGTTFVIFDHHTVKVQMYKYNSRIHQGVPTEKTKARLDWKRENTPRSTKKHKRKARLEKTTQF